jgi:hypothetical protein
MALNMRSIQVFFRSAPLCALLVICGCSLGVNELRSPKALLYVDSSGNDVGTYCVINVYARSYGIGYMLADPSDQSHDPKYYLMWPTVVRKGESFETQKRKNPSLFFPFVYGESIFVTAQIVLKKGFTPLVWNSYVDHTKPKTLVLRTGDSDSEFNDLVSGKASQERLREIFSTNRGEDQLKGWADHTPPLGKRSNVEIVDRYTEEERALLRHCYFDLSSKP